MGQLIPNSSFFISKCFMTLMTMTLMTTKGGRGDYRLLILREAPLGKAWR